MSSWRINRGGLNSCSVLFRRRWREASPLVRAVDARSTASHDRAPLQFKYSAANVIRRQSYASDRCRTFSNGSSDTIRDVSIQTRGRESERRAN